MGKKPSLTTINPTTGQTYTASELASFDLNKRLSAELPYGGETSLTAGSVREVIADEDNNFFDYSPSGYIIGDDNVETRAQLQPWTEQLSNSFVKMWGTASTTFLDGTLGTVVGLGSLATGGSFIDNPFSNWMVDLQEQMEKTLPNYYTKEEIENPFYKNLDTMNFWGDSILKNAGFAIGALAAGMVTSGIGNQLLGISRMMKTSKVLEGVAKAVKEGKTLTKAQANAVKSLSVSDEALASGKLVDDVIEELGTFAKSIKTKNHINQLASASLGAVGEARIEALHNSREFKKERQAELDAKLEEGILTPEEYETAVTNLDGELDNYRNTIFAANMALLSISNYAQFRNVFAKSYKPANDVAQFVNRTTEVVDGVTKVGYEVAKRNALDKTLDVLKYFKNPATEGLEESLQYAASQGTDHYYTMKTNGEANGSVQDILNATYRGLAEAFGTAEGWHNAVAGIIIGGLGVPTIAPNAEGKWRPTLAGGIRDDYRAQKALKQKAATGVETINKLLQDSPIRKLYDSAVADAAYQKLHSDALSNKDMMNAKTIEMMQLTNLVDAFVDIGKYEDFVQMITDERELSASSIREKYKTKVTSATSGQTKEVDFFKGFTDDQVLEYIKNKSQTALQRAEKIKQLKEDIDIRFSNYAEENRKDMLIKAAAVVDLDERANALIAEIKTATSLNFPRQLEKLKKNAPLYAEYLETFGELEKITTAVDLEQFLKKKDGLKNYTRLINEYLEYETDPRKKIETAEKARDLASIVAKRQMLNDTYFKMADPRYAENTLAAAKMSEEEKKLAATVRYENQKAAYDEHTNDDKEFGFDSTEFTITTGTEKKKFVEGQVKQTDGTYKTEKLEFTEVSEEKVSADGRFKYKTYTVVDKDGKTRQVNVGTPTETTESIPTQVKLKYRKGEADALYDEDGNRYDIDELLKDPLFMDPSRTNTTSVEEQRQQIINGVRKQTLQQLINQNTVLLKSLDAQIKATETTIQETKDLLERARKNKTVRTSVKINGRPVVKKAFQLREELARHEETLQNLIIQRNEVVANNRERILELAKTEAGQFRRGMFAADIKLLEQQVANADALIETNQKQVDTLNRLINKMIGLAKAVFPRFVNAYIKKYGINPSTVPSDQLELDPIFNKFKQEEINRFENILTKKEEVDSILSDIAELQKYKKEILDKIEKIKEDQKLFETQLAVVLEARRESQKPKVAKEKTTGGQTTSKKEGVTIEVTPEVHEKQHEKFTFASAMKTIKNMFSTTGRHMDKNGKETTVASQKRWYRTLPKISLDDKEGYHLRVVTDQASNPKLFEHIPDSEKGDAIIVVLYRGDKPVGEDLQPVDPTDSNRLVYTTLPRPTLETSEFGQRYHDAEANPKETETIQKAFEDFRNLLFERAKEGKESFLPINGKSLGILNKAAVDRKDPHDDRTFSVWGHIFTGTDAEIAKKYKGAKLEVAKSTNAEEQKDGTAKISAGGKEVQVRNGLTYLVTAEGLVIPMLQRKLTDQEVDTIYDLIDLLANKVEQVPTDEGYQEEVIEEKKKAAEKAKEKGKDKKGKFVRWYDRKNVKRPNYVKEHKINGKKVLGFYTTRTKKGKDKVVYKATTNSIDILKYLSQIIYFGPQTKKEGTVLTEQPNKQTTISIQKGTLTFWDFDKNDQVTIPLTPKELAQNEQALKKFLANKYHQTNSALLSSNTEFTHIEGVVTENGKKVADITRYTSYKDYLLSNKRGKDGKERQTSDIPLTTNVLRESDDTPQVMSMYVTFSSDPSHIRSAPGKLSKAPTPAEAIKDSRLVEVEQTKKNIEKDLSEKNFTNWNKYLVILDKLGLRNSYNDKAKNFNKDDYDIDEDLYDSLSADDKDAYETLLIIQNIINEEVLKIGMAAFTSGENVESDTEQTEQSGQDTFKKENEGVEGTEEEDFDNDNDEDEDEEGQFRISINRGGEKLLNPTAAKEWLAKNLPQVPVKIREKLINGLADGKISPSGIMYLSKLGGVGTEYHEAWHALTLGILSDQERTELYAEAKKVYGNPTQDQLNEVAAIYPRFKNNQDKLIEIWLEEQLAEDFRDYALSGGKLAPSSKIKAWYQQLWDAIKAFLGLSEAGVIENTFHNLYTGYYADAEYDISKVNQRLGTTSRYKPAKLSTPDSRGKTDPIKDAVYTKEAVDAIVHYFFRQALAKANSIEELRALEVEIIRGTNKEGKEIKESLVDELLTESMKLVRKDLLAIKSRTPEQNRLIAFIDDANGRKALADSTKEFLTKALGIDLNQQFLQDENTDEEAINRQEDLEELQSASKDSNVWAKDATTFHPREGANSFVKLMIAGLRDGVYNGATQTVVEKKGSTYGLPVLVDNSKAFNNVLKYLHTASSLEEMKARLEEHSDKFPYFANLLSILNDPGTANNPLTYNLMLVGFQQAMMKAGIKYRNYLLSEDGVLSVDPNSERQELRILQKWRQDLTETVGSEGAVVFKDKTTSGQVAFKKAVIKKAFENLPKTKDDFINAVNKLRVLGININPIGFNMDEKNALLDSAKYIIDQVVASKTEKVLTLEEFFSGTLVKGRLLRIAEIEANRNGEVTDMQHQRVDGKTIYGITEHNQITFVTQFINNMKPGTSREDFFIEFPQYRHVYASNSVLLTKTLFEETIPGSGDYIRTDVKINTVVQEAARINKPGEEGIVNTDLDKADRLWKTIEALINQQLPLLRTSDKSLEYSLGTGTNNTLTGVTLDNVGSAMPYVYDIFKGYLRDELNFALDSSADDIQFLKANKEKYKGLFLFSDLLQDLPSIREDQSVDDYISSNEEAIEKAIFDYIESHRKDIENRLIETGNVKGNTFTTIGIRTKELLGISSKNTLKPGQLELITKLAAINFTIGTIEQTKLFFGHPLFYKNLTDVLKRTAGAVGTKSVAITDTWLNTFLKESPIFGKSNNFENRLSYDGTFKTITMKEPKVSSDVYEEIKRYLIKAYSTDSNGKLTGSKIGEMLADNYAEIEEADGQGYITLPAYREFLYRTGDWTQKHESAYQNAMSGRKLSAKEISTYFNPLKAMNFGLNKVSETLSSPTYLKFSLVPLIPSVYKDTQMEDIAESLMENGISVMVYPSGYKVGARMGEDGFVPLYAETEENKVETIILETSEELPVSVMDYRQMGIQVKTGFEKKTKVTAGTQDRKLNLVNLFSNGKAKPITTFNEDGTSNKASAAATEQIVEEYHKTISDITERLAEKLIEDLDAEQVTGQPGTYRIRNVKKLYKILTEAGVKRNLPDNILKSFYVESDPDSLTFRFKYLIDAAPGRNKIENLLFSVINNQVLTHEYFGAAKVQVASTGFERNFRQYANSKGMLKSNPDLKFYRKGPSGQTLPMQIKVVADTNLQKVIDANGGREKINEVLKQLWSDEVRFNPERIAKIKETYGISPEMLQITGFRIPTGEAGTIEYMEIVEFLDPLAGDAIQLPSELVAKSGGDYDIDKLNVYFNQLKGNELISDNSFKGLQNTLIKLKKQILMSPEFYEDLLAPTSGAILKKQADTYRSKMGITQTVKPSELFTLGYNLDSAEYYLVGKAAVGVMAKHTSHHPLAQQTGLTVLTSYKNERGATVRTHMNFEGLVNDYSLGHEWDVRGQGKGYKVSQVLSAFINAFVDVAKDPFIFAINGSIKTANIYSYLTRRGVPIESAVAFMNQPVIKELYKQLSGSQAMFKKLNKEQQSLDDIYSSLKEKLVNLGNSINIDLTKTKFEALNYNTLESNLSKPLNSQDVTFLRLQYQVLEDFHRYNDNAEQLRRLMDATSDDTVRPKNFNALQLFKERPIPPMFNQEVAQRLWDNTFLRSFRKAQTLTTAYEPFFLTEHPAVKSQFTKFRNYLISNRLDTETINKIMDRAKNDFVVYVYAKHYATDKKMNTFTKIKEYFTEVAGKSLPQKMSSLLKNQTLIQENPALKQLYAVTDDPKTSVHYLKMFNGKINTYEQNLFTLGLKALKDTPNAPQPKVLAIFSLLQSGLNNSPITFFDKVPVESMHVILKDAFANVRALADSGNLSLVPFFHQFIRNNYQLSGLVPFAGTYSPGANEKKGITFDTQGYTIIDRPYFKNRQYLKVFAEYPLTEEQKKEYEKNNIPTGEFLLLMRTQGNKFVITNKQGSGIYLREYLPGVSESVLPGNNLETGVLKDLFPNAKRRDTKITDEILSVESEKNTYERIFGEQIKKECEGN